MNNNNLILKCLFLWVIFPSFLTYGQFEEFYKSEVKKTVQLEDSLQKSRNELNHMKLNFDSLVSEQQKSIEQLEKELKDWDRFKEERKELKKLTKDYESLMHENSTLKTELSKLRKTSEDNEKLKSELEKLKAKQKELASQIIELNSVKQQVEKSEKVQKSLLQKIKQRYQLAEDSLLSFGAQIFQSDIFTLNLFFPEQKDLIQYAEKWLTIQNAKLVLTQKYDKANVDKHISNLKAIEGVNNTSQLIKDIESYHTKNEAVKKLIQKLNEHNEVKVKGTTLDLIKEKRREIYTILCWELDLYAELNGAQYIYLNDIIELVKKTKDNDIDADLSFVKDLL